MLPPGPARRRLAAARLGIRRLRSVPVSPLSGDMTGHRSLELGWRSGCQIRMDLQVEARQFVFKVRMELDSPVRIENPVRTVFFLAETKNLANRRWPCALIQIFYAF